MGNISDDPLLIDAALGNLRLSAGSPGIDAGDGSLLPLDFADLDGAELLRDEPATGVEIVRGKISMPNNPGCGSSVDLEQIHLYETTLS